MMIKITHPACVRMLRDSKATNTEIVETATCKAFGIVPRSFSRKRHGRMKTDCPCIAVKIHDTRIVEMLKQHKRSCGISHHFAVENAMLQNMPRKYREGDDAK